MVESPLGLREKVAANVHRMTLQLAREFDVTELEIIRALPAGTAIELDASQWEPILRALESLGRVHVIVSNGATTLESFGQFGNFSTWGGFFNVQTATLDMHIRPQNLAAVFGVTKPGHMDGVPTVSLQFYDDGGHSAFKVFLTFGGKVPSEATAKTFTEICARFVLRPPAKD